MNRFKNLTVYTIAIFLITLVSCNSNNNSMSSTTMDVIHQRTSIRKYQNRPVSKEQLEMLVKAGMAAPSAMNKQPWQFIIVEDKEILQALGKDIQTSKMVQQAPAAIIVCGDMQKAGEGWLQQYWIQDCSAASQNILLAITDMGLGGVWASIYPAPERMKIVGSILNLPEHIIPLNIIPVGYPDEPQSPKDKWDAKKVHWNKFGE
jgi:nitroreductase